MGRGCQDLGCKRDKQTRVSCAPYSIVATSSMPTRCPCACRASNQGTRSRYPIRSPFLTNQSRCICGIGEPTQPCVHAGGSKHNISASNGFGTTMFSSQCNIPRGPGMRLDRVMHSRLLYCNFSGTPHVTCKEFERSTKYVCVCTCKYSVCRETSKSERSLLARGSASRGERA